MYSHMPELTPAIVLLSVYKLWATIVPGLNPCHTLHSLGLKSRATDEIQEPRNDGGRGG